MNLMWGIQVVILGLGFYFSYIEVGLLNTCELVAISILSYLFSDVFCIIDDEDSVSVHNEDSRHILGFISTVVSMCILIFIGGWTCWFAIFGLPILIRQSYEDFLSYKAYELPLFLATVAGIIYVWASGNFNTMYLTFVLLMGIWGLNKVFGKADMYAYIIILSLGSNCFEYLIMSTISSSIIAVIFGLIKRSKEKVKLTEVRVALLPIIYICSVLSYAICNIVGLM